MSSLISSNPRLIPWPALWLMLLLHGCNQAQDAQNTQSAVTFHAHDECHVCGMLITPYPGPKAQAYQHNYGSQVLKFCSTRDLFAYLLEPDVSLQIEAVYVHDMSRSDWNSPDDAHLIPARDAWYVVGHPLRGAMGPSPAPFAQRQPALDFAKQHGGQVLKFEQITLDHLEEDRPRQAIPKGMSTREGGPLESASSSGAH